MLKFATLRDRLRARRMFRQLKPYFDRDYYLSSNPDVARAGVNPLQHYILTGWREGRDPTPDFSSSLYLQANPDVRDQQMNPFFHYIRFGRAEKRSLSLARINELDRAWIESAFDASYYRSWFLEGTAPDDPVGHYLTSGWRTGLNPNKWFSTQYYLIHNPDVREAGINPFIHYLRHGQHEQRKALPGTIGAEQLYREQAASVDPGPHFEDLDPEIGKGRAPLAKVLAYYLPQFHAFAENDRFWGKGFTEWRNVARGLPRLKGHVQPRIPRDLGNYSLENPDTLLRQIDMARVAGLFGFCFYYYWFDGRRVMARPTEQILNDPDIDFPFCLMWANENWTRTWDGMDNEVLLEQTYDPDHDESLIDDLARHFKDPRYVRIGDRPLFFIYRPDRIPDAAVTITKWRHLFEKRYGLVPIIMMAQGFGNTDPETFGLDGAIEFPPHKLCEGLMRDARPADLLDREYTGNVIQYDEMIARSVSEPSPNFPLIRTTTPYWDNEARRPGRSTVMQGSTPSKFTNWLRHTISFARKNPVYGEAIIAVNAWNEWAEGAYLEPDTHFGGAYLNALSRAVFGVPALTDSTNKRKVILVGHDAHPHGAQYLVSNLARVIKRQFGADIVILLCKGGPMVEHYREICETHVLSTVASEAQSLIGDLASRGFTQVIVNSTASGWVTPMLDAFDVTTLIHELGRLRNEYNLTDSAGLIAQHSNRVIFPAEVVRDSFLDVAAKTAGRVEVKPQGLYNTKLLNVKRSDGGIRAELGIPEHARLVINVGFADLRKGFDLFVSTAQLACEERDDIWFVWLGNAAPDVKLWLISDMQSTKQANHLRFVGHVDDVERWYAAADVLFLSAREDPFPSVVLEALAMGLPVVGYQGTGGCDALIEQHGTLVPRSDNSAAARAITQLIDQPVKAQAKAAQARRDEILRDYMFDDYAHGLLNASTETPMARVSVIVPNYNYAHCLEERLLSIFNQSHPVFEVIVLDDASTDDSVAVITRVAETSGRDITLIVNEENSGSPFKQWRRGLEIARGDYVWIAEADDVSAPEFLDRMVEAMQSGEANLSFADSWQIDEDGKRIGNSYKDYMNGVEPKMFDGSFTIGGDDFLTRALAIKNVILNVSSVVFRRRVLLDAMRAAGEIVNEMNVAGDWRIYAEICAAGGRVAYLAQALNGHRRHVSSVTHTLKIDRHLQEIKDMQGYVRTLVKVDDKTTKAQEEHLAAAQKYLEGMV